MTWSCDFFPRSCDLFLVVRKNAYVIRSCDFSHGHVTCFWRVRKFDYVSRPYDLVM